MTFRLQLALAMVIGLSLAAHAPSRAEVASTSDAGFELRIQRSVPVSPRDAYAVLARVGAWWDGAHTYSGSSRNLRLEPRAGGCFCERWRGGEVEHGRVVNAVPGERLRLEAALGPLQELPVRGVLDFGFAAAPSGSIVTLTYRVAGDGASLRGLAHPVEQVLAGQMDRFAAHVAAQAR